MECCSKTSSHLGNGRANKHRQAFMHTTDHMHLQIFPNAASIICDPVRLFVCPWQHSAGCLHTDTHHHQNLCPLSAKRGDGKSTNFTSHPHKAPEWRRLKSRSQSTRETPKFCPWQFVKSLSTQMEYAFSRQLSFQKLGITIDFFLLLLLLLLNGFSASFKSNWKLEKPSDTKIGSCHVAHKDEQGEKYIRCV